MSEVYLRKVTDMTSNTMTKPIRDEVINLAT